MSGYTGDALIHHALGGSALALIRPRLAPGTRLSTTARPRRQARAPLARTREPSSEEPMRSFRFGTLVPLGLLVGAACGGGMPGARGSRESGQSKLMDSTFAGSNKCNARSHDRPFIIEWDATDMSSFESHASNDIVFVRYEGCEMKVLDQCRNDSVRGSLGAYKAVDWTSGSLEKLAIATEDELVAKLPLGVASLGGRVHGGEKFQMEYYVAGTRNATRDAVYLKELAELPGCKGATHFVYGYNLGAFALGSVSELNASVEGSLYGFGAGTSHSSSQKADKKGGDLGTCKSDTAREIEGCKVPIRLTLREISPGDNPDATAAKAPETDDSLNLAGKVEQKIEMGDDARAHYEAASEKMRAKDGKGCLAELDAHDKLDAKHMSSDPKSGIFGLMRGQCLMLAGKCDAGKTAFRKAWTAGPGANDEPERVDQVTEAMAATNCQGGSMSPRDQLLQALKQLTDGGTIGKKDKALCASAWATVKKLGPQVKPKDDSDTQVIWGVKNAYSTAALCLTRAGDCDGAFAAYKEGYPPDLMANLNKGDAKVKEQVLRGAFESSNQKCKK